MKRIPDYRLNPPEESREERERVQHEEFLLTQDRADEKRARAAQKVAA